MLRRHDPRGVAPLVCSIGASPDDETPGRVRVYGAGKATREARRRSSSSEGSMPRSRLPRRSPTLCGIGASPMKRRPGGSRRARRGRRGAGVAGVRHRAKARCHGRIRIFPGDSPRAKALGYKDTIPPGRSPASSWHRGFPDEETPGRVQACGAGKATREARRRSSSSEGSMLRRHDCPGRSPHLRSIGASPMTRRPGGSGRAGRGRRGARVTGVRPRANSNFFGGFSSGEGPMLPGTRFSGRFFLERRLDATKPPTRA